MSSSGSDSDTPLSKRQHTLNKTMDEKKDMAELTMKEVKLTDLYTLLMDVKSSQEQLKQGQDSFQESVHTRISNLESKIDKNLESIQNQFQYDIQEVRREIQRDSEKTKEKLDMLSSSSFLCISFLYLGTPLSYRVTYWYGIYTLCTGFKI